MPKHDVPDPGLPGRALVVSARIDLLDAVLELLPDPGLVPEVAVDVRAARRSWDGASAVLVGPDLVEALARARLRRRPGVALLLPPADEPPPDWSRGLTLGVERLLEPQEAADWLSARARRASTAAAVATSASTVLGVTGARGGCGASTLAAALGREGARGGCSTLLIDLDHAGGGLDVLLGLEDVPGPRWPDLDVPALAAAELGQLPSDGRLHVLSAARGLRDHRSALPDRAATAAVLGLAASAFALVVVDIPRHQPADVLPDGTVVLLLVPDEVRGCAAAAARLETLAPCPDVRLVVCGTSGSLDDDAIATALERPVAGRMRTEPGLGAAVDRGSPPGSRPRSALARLGRDLLAQLAADVPRARP